MRSTQRIPPQENTIRIIPRAVLENKEVNVARSGYIQGSVTCTPDGSVTVPQIMGYSQEINVARFGYIHLRQFSYRPTTCKRF